MTANLLARIRTRGPAKFDPLPDVAHTLAMFVRPAFCFRLLILLFLTCSNLLFVSDADAKARLMTISDGVIAYSGPGQFYRPLAVFPERTELRASSKVVRNKNGAFYRVLIQLSEKKKAVGFVSVQSNVRYVDDKLEEDDLEKYGEVALVSRAAQVSYSLLRNDSSLWTLGYMRYLSPGFYVKGYGGQFNSASASALVAGGEVGNDALLYQRLSGLVSYSAGLFSPSEAGSVFSASSKVNMIMMASFGVRYNFNGAASLSAAVTQGVFFNADNSLVTNGAAVTFEVGL